jgi:hypothetical protein
MIVEPSEQRQEDLSVRLFADRGRDLATRLCGLLAEELDRRDQRGARSAGGPGAPCPRPGPRARDGALEQPRRGPAAAAQLIGSSPSGPGQNRAEFRAQLVAGRGPGGDHVLPTAGVGVRSAFVRSELGQGTWKRRRPGPARHGTNASNRSDSSAPRRGTTDGAARLGAGPGPAAPREGGAAECNPSGRSTATSCL